MTAETILGTKEWRQFYIWFLTESGKLRGFILAVLSLCLFFYWGIPSLRPAVTTPPPTVHQIYLPLNYRLVSDVVNILPGVHGFKTAALMQVECFGIEQYQAIAGSYPLHYLTVNVDSADSINSGNVIRLDYYAKKEASTQVLHVASQITSPIANCWGFYYAKGKMSIKGNQLIVPREFEFPIRTILFLIFLAITLVIAAVAVNLGLSWVLQRAYRSYFTK